MNNDETFIKCQTELANEIVSEDLPEDYDSTETIPLEQMKIAQEAIAELSEIRDTITLEGVSSHDLVAVKAIQDRLKDNGVNVPNNVSLESYIKLTSNERTSLNMDISNESITKTIIATIKKWIHWLIDAFTKTIRWFKSLTLSDDLAKKKIATITTAALKMESVYKNNVSKLSISQTNKLLDKQIELAKANLMDAKLERCEAMLAAFGEKKPSTELKMQHHLLQLGSEHLIKVINSLGKILQNHDSSNIDNSLKLMLFDPKSKIENVLKDLHKLFEKSDKDSYLLDVLGDHFFESTKRVLTGREFLSYKTIYEAYVKGAEALTKANRSLDKSLTNDDDLENIQKHISIINEYLNGINEAVDLYNKYKAYMIKASAVHFNHHNQALEFIIDIRMQSIVTDQDKANVDSLKNVVSGIRKSVGL